jgi:hypothetical protein
MSHTVAPNEDPLVNMLQALAAYKDDHTDAEVPNNNINEATPNNNEVTTITPTTSDPTTSTRGFSAIVERLAALPLAEQHVQPYLLVGEGCNSHRCAHRRAQGLDGHSVLGGSGGGGKNRKGGRNLQQETAFATLERETREAAPQRRVPCLNCFGLCSYCSFRCQSDHYPLHTYDCLETLKRMANLRDGLFPMRQRQIDQEKKGFMRLVGNLINNAPRSQLLDSFFLIPFPHDPYANFAHNHPIKRIVRQGAGVFLNQNLCLAHVYQKVLTRMVKQARGQGSRDEPMFIIVYPPDFGFCVLLTLPLELGEHFDERQQAETEIVICPCTAHTRRTG